MKLLVATAVLLALVSTGYAVNIFVWDDDRGDILPGGGGTEVPIRDALIDLGYVPTVSQYLPASLLEYDIVFSVHGWYDC